MRSAGTRMWINRASCGTTGQVCALRYCSGAGVHLPRHDQADVLMKLPVLTAGKDGHGVRDER